MRLPKLNRIVVLAALFSVSLGASAGFAVGWPQRRSNDLPSSGPTIVEAANYDPWQIVEKPKSRVRVRDYQPYNAEERLLVLSPEDQKQFAHLINQPNAGGFRLLSPYHVSRGVISIDNPELSRRPGFSDYASAYSFTRKKHGHGVNGWDRCAHWNLIDLRLIRGVFRSATAEDSLGLMVRLGDVPLEEITEQTIGVKELTEFVPPGDPRTAVVLYWKHLRGYRLNGFRYGSKADAFKNNTYVLRSILDRRGDQLIAVRVIGEDEQGSLSIVWKKLRDYPIPSWSMKKRKHRHPDWIIVRPPN